MRQLENAVFRAVVLAEGDEVGVAEFPQIAAQVAGFAHGAASRPRCRLASIDAGADRADGGGRARRLRFDQRRACRPACRRQRSRCSIGHGEVRPLEEIEAEVIRFAIAHYRGQMSEVARRLQIGRSTLYRKVDALGHDADLSGTEASAL